MAIKALVDNPERYDTERGGVVFPGGTKNIPFEGSLSSFLQVKACSLLKIHDISEVEETSLTTRIDYSFGDHAGDPMAAHPGAVGGAFSETEAAENEQPQTLSGYEDHTADEPEDYGTGDEPPALNDGDLEATDDARELAEAEGVDLSEIDGSGYKGRVKVGDVRSYLESKKELDDDGS